MTTNRHGYDPLATDTNLAASPTRLLCCWWNAATDPASLRSEDEHLAATADARRINAVLQTRHGWTESDYSGRRYLTERS